MNAYICEKYGPPEVLQFSMVDKPVPGDKEVLIKVHATTVNAADTNTRGLTHIPSGLRLLARAMLGFKKPRIPIQGGVVAGEVEAVGKDVSYFKAGDRVYGTGPELGGYAEYAIRQAKGAVAMIPGNISFEEAATIPYGALTAFYFLVDKARVGKGQKVLVNGASGGVGVFAVQIARYFGAEVSAVCSARNADLVRSLGAHRVYDYTREDFRESEEKWDIIFDMVVGKTSFKRAKKVLEPKGYYLAVAGGLNDMLHMIWTSIRGGRKVVFGGGTACEKQENLVYLNELLENGEVKAVVDSIYPFEQIVEAHRQSESGSKKGSVAIRIIEE
jgi:NADPH2:quinone reductase